jgi:hypothetical protein
MRSYRVCFAMLLALALCAHGTRYAILVGNNSGTQSEATLKYVDRDLATLRTVLTGLCGFDSRNITTLFNGGPEDLQRLLDGLGSGLQAGGDDLFFFYFTGHADETCLKMGPERFLLSDLKTRFGRVPAPIKIAVFDACQSGSFTRLKGGTLAEPFLFLSDEKVKGQVILSSSSASESSQESDGLKSSVFTFHLINALRGSADASGDGKITLGEAYQYAYNHTVATTASSSGGTQHPGYQFNIQGEGEIVLADISLRTSGIVLPAGIDGGFTILDDKAAIVADFTKESGAPMMIALNPGAYQITRRGQGTVSTAQATVGEGQAVTMSEEDFSTLARQSMRVKGADDNDTHVDAAVTVAYHRWHPSALGAAIVRQYQGYEFFNLRPSFEIHSGGFVGSAGVEIWIRNLILCNPSLGYTTSSHGVINNGSRLNVDGKTYQYSLAYNDRLDVYPFTINTGVRVPKGVLRNLMFTIGLELYLTQYSIATDFTDSLYRYTTSRSNEDRGIMIMPIIGMGYRMPVWKGFWAGVHACYRYQDQEKALSSLFEGSYVDDSPPSPYEGYTAPIPLEFNFGGLELGLTLSYRLGGDR